MILPLLINLLLIIASAQHCDDGFLNGYRTCHADTTILSSILPTSYATASRHALKFARSPLSTSPSSPPSQSSQQSPSSSSSSTLLRSHTAATTISALRPWNWSHGSLGLSGYLYFSGHDDFRQVLLECRSFAHPSTPTLEKGLCVSRAARFAAGALFFFGVGDAALDVLRVLVGRQAVRNTNNLQQSLHHNNRRPGAPRGAYRPIVVRREPAKATRASTLFAADRSTLETGMVPGG